MPTCLITGASRGLGLELARQYAADGWAVVATCRQPAQATALAGLSGNLRVEALDVTNFARIEALHKALAGTPIDLLINNAGVYGPRVVPYDQIDYGAWAEVMRVNVFAPVKMSATFADLVARSQRRLIVALSSLMGSIADNTSGGSYIYRSSKAALNAAMKSLAIDLGGRGISVAVLHPGWVRTDMGGSGAPLEVFESVSGLREVIAGLGPASSGRFFNYDGRELPW